MTRVLLALVLLQAACGPLPPPGGPTVPPATVVPVACVVSRQAPAQPVAGALCGMAGQFAATNADGYALLPAVPTGVQVLTVTASGYRPYEGAYQIAGAADLPVTLVLATPTLSRLYVQGRQFVTEAGESWIYRGVTDFPLFQHFLEGRDLEPVLDDRLAVGANTLRVLLMFDGGLGRFHPADYPDYWTRLPAFVDRLAEHGLRVELTVFADAQRVMPDHDAQQTFLARVVETVRERPSVLVELVNEWPQNGVDPQRFEQPAGVLSSRGSALGDQAPPLPGWHYHTWHGRRDWPKVVFSAEDAWYVAMGITATGQYLDTPRPILMDEMIGFDEVNQPGRRSNDPELARILGLTAVAYGAGGTFHSEDGLWSRPFRPVTRQCAEAFFRAMP